MPVSRHICAENGNTLGSNDLYRCIKAEVTSSNTVGYQKIALGANAMDIKGIQFQQIGGGAIDLQTLSIEGQAATSSGTDWIKIWDPATRRYVQAYWFGDDEDGIYDPDDTEYDNTLGVGWGTPLQFQVDASLTAGQGIWAQSGKGGNIVVSGEVPGNTISIGANAMTLAANPLPMDVDLQDIILEGNAATSSGTDWIKIWNPSTRNYVQAYWFGDDEDGIYDPDDTEYDNTLGTGWGTPLQFEVVATIPAGQGFWIQSVKGGTLVFPALPVTATGND